MDNKWKQLVIKGIALVLLLIIISLSWRVANINALELDDYKTKLSNIFGESFLGRSIEMWIFFIHHILGFFCMGILADICMNTEKNKLIPPVIAIIIVYFLAVTDEAIREFGVAFDVNKKYFLFKIVAGVCGVVLVEIIKFVISVIVGRKRVVTSE